jgi:hypothetical protein
MAGQVIDTVTGTFVDASSDLSHFNETLLALPVREYERGQVESSQSVCFPEKRRERIMVMLKLSVVVGALLFVVGARPGGSGLQHSVDAHHASSEAKDEVKLGYGKCSRCSCPSFSGSGYTCHRGGCGHHYDLHW